jgi:PAS domain S-box-containing protein
VTNSPPFSRLVDIDQVQQLLKAHNQIHGIPSAITDENENILVAVGWQDICVQFHRLHLDSCVRCRESDAFIKSHLHRSTGEYLEYTCKNGLWNVAMPIKISGRHVATFFISQFFYDDGKPDLDYFRAQAGEFGFNENDYLKAVGKVPVHSREHIKKTIEFSRNLVQVMAELGQKNMKLAQEIEERKKAEIALQTSKDHLDKIINSLPDPIFVKDRLHRLMLVNDAKCSLAGRSRKEIIGRTEYELFDKGQVRLLWETDEIVFETEQENIDEEDIVDALGRKRTLLTKKSLYTDSKGDKFILGISRDITKLKQKERELRTLNEELESRVVARTAELDTLNADLLREIRDHNVAEEQLRQQKQLLEELNCTLEKKVDAEVSKNRSKDIMLIQQNRRAALGEMLDHIAHQWKQPINAISLIAQDLEGASAYGELTDDYLGEAVHKTLALLEHMTQTIDVFRNFYKPEKEQTVFLINDSIDLVVGFIAPALRSHAIAVELDLDPGVAAVGYPKEYAQVLLNILGNARNALAERKIEKPRIALRAFSDGGRAVVTVTDNAGGIPATNLARIFEPYFTTRKQAGGTGVGLYMSKNIIEKNMAGKLSVANVDGGARFRIELPVP